VDALKGTAISIYRLIFTTEDNNTRNALARYYYDKLNGISPTPEVISTIGKLKSNGFTRGHWFRGVE